MIYLNNAATSYPKPECVAKAMYDALINPPGSGNRGGIEHFNVFAGVRKELAPLLGISNPDGIALGNNATWGLNIGIFGYPFKAGDYVVTTKAEHNSVLRPLFDLESKGIIKAVYLDVDETGCLQPELWEEAMERYHPALSVFTHASNVTGAVNDVKTLAGISRKYDSAVLLDASQTLGWLPVKAESWNVDMVSFTGHKYLLGPQGTGGLWVREGLVLNPHMVGGTGIKSDLDTMPEEMPIHLEAGTGNEPSFWGLLSALEWRREHPIDYKKTEDQLNLIRKTLKELGAKVIIPKGESTPVISFCFENITVEETGYMLQEGADIICRTGLHCAPKIFGCLGVGQTVRLSLSRFTTDEEVSELTETLKSIID